jgi:hypothetical protein
VDGPGDQHSSDTRILLGVVGALVLGIAVAIAVVVPGSGADDDEVESHAADIIDAEVDPDTPAELSLSVAACRSSRIIVTITETVDEVRLAAVAEESSRGLACADGASASLERPLGDRRLVDDRDGSRVPIRLLPG